MTMIKQLLVVGCGGFAGAILRYLVSGWAQGLFKSGFPYGTMTVNAIGSLVLGFLAGVSQNAIVSPTVRMFLGIGLLGAFTTFSTFSYETMMLIRTGSFFEAFLNVAVSIFIGLLLVYAGFVAGQAIT